jgi:hypothetical protein
MRTTIPSFVLLLALVFAAAPAHAEAPWWWASCGVTATTGVQTNDFAAATQGQVKWIASRACAVLDANLLGGAGEAVSNLVRSFQAPGANDYAAVNAGQLKAVAAPFYDRLRACGWPCVLPDGMTTNQAYPWSGAAQPPNDYAAVNIGQVKYAFSFDPFDVYMVPDFDRNGVIDASDRKQLEEKRMFRFWINDDLDVGDDATCSQDDAPAGSYTYLREDPPLSQRSPNCEDDTVNGVRDLVDFFPVLITFPIDRFPPGEYTYTLTQCDGALNFVYTSLSPGNVRAIHTERLATGFGPFGNQPAASAPVLHFSVPGVQLNHEWLRKGNRVILIEGCWRGTQPLMLDITKDGRLYCHRQLEISVSPVNKMFRYLNVRTADRFFTTDAPHPAEEGRWPTDLGEPPNFPDGFYNRTGEAFKTFVAVHGLDWDESETPAGNAEIFKRFFQSGLNARFIGVSWASNTGRKFGAPLDYGRDVIGAFITARLLTESLSDFQGSNTSVFAHSLGNMVVSSAIEDHGFTAGNYFMVNAAVPAEAYDGRAAILPQDQLRMIPPKWKNTYTSPAAFSYSTREMCAAWSTLFTTNDPRSAVTWDRRFYHVPDRTTLWQFYSSGEEILRGSDGTIPHFVGLPKFVPWNTYSSVIDREYVWAYNEMTKGNLYQLLSLFVPYHDQAGWGYGTNWIQNPGAAAAIPWTATQIAALPATDLIAKPLFRDFDRGDSKAPNWGNCDDWIYRPDCDPAVPSRLPFLPLRSTSVDNLKNHAKLLAESIPPLSDAAGYGPLTRLLNPNQERAFDLNTPTFAQPDLWPSVRPTKTPRQVLTKRWLHGDYKDPSYLYVHVLYDSITSLLR